MPRVREIATALTLIYLGFTVLCAILYWLAGMTPFEALAHSLTTGVHGRVLNLRRIDGEL
jgi:trk system potassium uptake protein TrkH